MNDKEHKDILLALSVGLGLWGILIIFENAYFAAPAYGVAVPYWAQWVGVLPLWSLDVVDTVALFLVVGLVVLSIHWGHARRIGSRGTGEISAILGWLVILAFLAVVAYAVFDLTLPDILHDIERFVDL